MVLGSGGTARGTPAGTHGAHFPLVEGGRSTRNGGRRDRAGAGGPEVTCSPSLSERATIRRAGAFHSHPEAHRRTPRSSAACTPRRRAVRRSTARRRTGDRHPPRDGTGCSRLVRLGVTGGSQVAVSRRPEGHTPHRGLCSSGPSVGWGRTEVSSTHRW
ncbi:hypothetical protein FHS40_006468 [Streptomyces spectabilis]|uniref:Uncharacterized protein n=1 Tax=Streptomyces spectabilis TaxID=68270 RepID=A0A7W8EX28_STRST|nr:hypothetical protein [Streptomyces spectabilis]